MKLTIDQVQTKMAAAWGRQAFVVPYRLAGNLYCYLVTDHTEHWDPQRRHIEEFCERHSLILVHFFADEARVGSTTVGREGLEDLLYLARQEPRPLKELSSGLSRACRAINLTRSSCVQT